MSRVEIVRGPEALAPLVVERIYAAASAQPPLSEDPSVAAMYAGLYSRARDTPGFVMTVAWLEGDPVGFAYGHSWSWQTQNDAWSMALHDRLGDDVAQQIAESFAVDLVAVLPSASGAGIGRRLLQTLLSATGHATAWLQTTDIDSPARRLYQRAGWRTLGYGPAAPDGRPGLVLVHQRNVTRDH